MKRITYHSVARHELAEAVEWYQSQNPDVAERFFRDYLDCIAKVQAGPKRFRRIHPLLRRANLESFPYSLIYRETDRSLQILALAHAKRRPGYWRARVAEV